MRKIMSKTKSELTPHYELLYIISNKYSEEEIKPIIAKTDQLIEQNGGQITFKEDWGKRKLAYPIKSLGFGYYSLVEFDATGSSLAKIGQVLAMESDIIRHQIVAKKVKTAAQIKKAEEVTRKIAAKATQKEKLEEEKKKVKVDLQDLDERLDRILETDDLL